MFFHKLLDAAEYFLYVTYSKMLYVKCLKLLFVKYSKLFNVKCSKLLYVNLCRGNICPKYNTLPYTNPKGEHGAPQVPKMRVSKTIVYRLVNIMLSCFQAKLGGHISMTQTEMKISLYIYYYGENKPRAATLSTVQQCFVIGMDRYWVGFNE